MRDHQFFSKTDRHIHPQPAADARRIVLEHAVQFVEVAQQILRPLVVDHPILGELNPTGGTVQEPHAKMAFQGLNLPRDAAFRQRQGLGGAGKTLQIRYANE
ncbi:Uncharacterised protein [Klebsiella aerogenes]|nr:Uncharacterised protein [Klebsiella aerogenes]